MSKSDCTYLPTIEKGAIHVKHSEILTHREARMSTTSIGKQKYDSTLEESIIGLNPEGEHKHGSTMEQSKRIAQFRWAARVRLDPSQRGAR